MSDHYQGEQGKGLFIATIVALRKNAKQQT
jgi:hypothetical protein